LIFAEIVMPTGIHRHAVLTTLLTALPWLCSGMLLLGCSSSTLRQDVRATAAVPSADENYLRGRNLHLARRHEEAIAAYQAALRADGAHVNARNGLAIAYAEQRDFDRAIPIWRELTRGATMGAGQSTAFLFGNLGYAYFLNGNYDEALVALEKACLLDPLNGRAWQYMGETLQKLGQEERAQQMLRQAEALREHDFRADYTAAGGGSRMPPIEQAVQAVETTTRPDREWAFVEVVTKSSGILELRRVTPAAPTRKEAPRAAPKPGPDRASQDKPASVVAALEISNGNGRQGLARMLSRQIRDPGVKIVRLTNEKGFKVRQTRIEYQPAFREVAERLAQRYGTDAPVEVSMAGRANVRLVIGRDLPQRPLADRSGSLLAAHASASESP
jgi:tetratricopeptide (TPR) repeat protein